MRHLLRIAKGLSLLLCSALLCCAALAETASPEPAAHLTLKRDFSVRYVSPGDWVTLNYTVRNESDSPIGNITVTDPLVGEVGYISRLDTGNKKVISMRVRVTDECMSSPAASYLWGEDMLNVSAAPEPIYIENVALSAVLTAQQSGDSVVLTLTVRNQGNAPLYSLKAADATLGELGGAVSVLAPGEEHTFTRKARPREETLYQCDVSAVSSAGKAVTLRSNDLSAAAAPAEETGVTLNAAPGEENDVPAPFFTLTLINNTNDALRGVVLTEPSSGATRTLHLVPARGNAQLLWPYEPAQAPAQVHFEASVGGEIIALTELIELMAAPESSGDATATPEPGVNIPGGVSYRLEDNPQTFRDMMLYTASLLAVILLAWALSTRRRKRRAQKKRNQRRKEQKKKQRAQSAGDKNRKSV